MLKLGNMNRKNHNLYKSIKYFFIFVLLLNFSTSIPTQETDKSRSVVEETQDIEKKAKTPEKEDTVEKEASQENKEDGEIKKETPENIKTDNSNKTKSLDEAKEKVTEEKEEKLDSQNNHRIKIKPYSLDVQEGGKGAVYTISLSSEPQEEVVIELKHNEQVILNTTTLKFTANDWQVPKMVVVTPIDDFLVEESPHKSIINHTVISSDSNYNGIKLNDVHVSIQDNDEAKLLVSSDTIETEEGSKIGIYTIQLNSQPYSDITIDLTHDEQLKLDKKSITFTPKNWKSAMAVVVTPVDDPIVEENPHKSKITHTINTTDKYYKELQIQGVEVSIVDNDSYGITVSPLELELSEGEKKSYTVKLTSQPKSDVTFTINHDAQVKPDKETIVFSKENWNTVQKVEFEAVDDSIVEENPHSCKINHNVTSSDNNYSGLTIQPIKVTIKDNDSPGIEITPRTFELKEGEESKKYSIQLKSQPTSDVILQILVDKQIHVDKESISFTSSNWNLPQSISIKAVDDSEIETNPHNSEIQFKITSSDEQYTKLKIDDTMATIQDNDAPGIITTPKSFALTEGQNGIYTIELKSQPKSDIKILLSQKVLPTIKEQLEIKPHEIIFTKENWQTPQTVEIIATDDSLVEEKSIETLLTHTIQTEDENYKGIELEDTKVVVQDNDSPGVTVSLFSLKVTEGGEAVEYTIHLNSQPISPVNIELLKDGQLELDKEVLEFTPENWKEAQTIKVNAVDDPTIESDPHLGTITHKVKSEDKAYHDLVLNNTIVSISDNDSAGVSIEPKELEISEDGKVGEYDIKLTAQPTSKVQIEMSFDKQVKLEPNKVTFTKSNWDAPQKIKVTAIDDTITEGEHTSSIQHSVEGKGYENVEIEDVKIKIEDNESSEYVDNMDGTVKDVATNLVWMKCSQGQKWSGEETNTCEGNAVTFQVCDGGNCETQDASKSCSSLNQNGGFGGKTNWRLPTKEELGTLVLCSSGPEKKDLQSKCNKGSSSPTIDTNIFPNTMIGFYRTSSSESASNVSYVYFGLGYAGSSLKSDKLYVRCVSK